MQTGETAWSPTGVGKVSICAGLHGGRWSHRVVEVFQDLCSFSGLPSLLRDIATKWKDGSELSATQHMFENYASQTTGMSKPILGETRQT